jgi:RND family efflux transporter MFP subunit
MRPLFFAGLLCASFAFARDTPVVIDSARIDSVVQSTTLTARVVATETVMVPADTEETVRQINARIGDRVAEGDLIATLESQNVRLEVRSLEARQSYLEESLALLVEQERLRTAQVERATSLNTRDLLTRDAQEQAALNLMATRANRVRTAFELKDVELDLADARKRLAQTNVYAPSAGRILAVTAQSGGYVRKGDALFEILPDGALELDAEIRADAYESLSVGQIVTASLRGQLVDVSVRALLAEQNQRTGARTVRFAWIDEPPNNLVVGEAARFELPVGTNEPQVTIAKDAVMPVVDGHRVVVIEDGKAVPRSVRLGPGLPGRIAILEGIEAGDQVVVQGQEGLRPGQAVVIVETDA